MELEDYLQAAAGLLAVAIFVVAFLAYRRRPTRRTLMVAGAFGLFALRGLLLAASDFLVGPGAGDVLESLAVPLEAGFLLLIAAALLQA